MLQKARNKISPRLIPLWEGRSLLLAVGLALTLCAVLLLLRPPEMIRFADQRAYDLMLAGRTVAPRSALPVIVGIDDKSLTAHGQWPWPRYRLAMLVDKLSRQGAAAIALDMLMPEPDRTSPEIILRERSRDLGEKDIFVGSPAGLPSNDRQLVEALRQSPSVLGFLLEFRGTAHRPAFPPEPLRQMIVHLDKPGIDHFPIPIGITASLPALSGAARTTGFTNAQPDWDGVLRRTPIVLRDGDRWYPSLALAALLLAEKDRNLRLVRQSGEMFLEWHGRRVPLDTKGNMLLDFRGGRRSFPYLSAADVLADRVPAGSLRGRLIFVGAWAEALGDRHVTPLDRSLSGLEVHATVAENLLAGKFLARPDWARGAELFAVLAFGILTAIALSRAGFLPSLAIVIAGITLPAWGTALLFHSRGLFVSPVLPSLVVLAQAILLSLIKYGIETRKVYQRTRDLLQAQDAIIISMTALAEARDNETGGHIIRTQRYVEALARQLVSHPRFKPALSDDAIELLAKSAPLHDIGKVGIPDRILCKPGSFTAEEFQIMKSHTLIGAAALAKTVATRQRPESLAFLTFAREIAESHHEKWDGSGYPHGLRGDDIPMAGRLMALADVYDALISKRIYKPAFPHEKARDIIIRGGGSHFDPDVVTAFVQCEEQFRVIASELAEED